MLSEAAKLVPPTVSDTAWRAALEESTPSEAPIEDAARLRELFDLGS